jgi:hypothetical protein
LPAFSILLDLDKYDVAPRAAVTRPDG